jgi:membrane fusion protein (multidrug efflux system)
VTGWRGVAGAVLGLIAVGTRAPVHAQGPPPGAPGPPAVAVEVGSVVERAVAREIQAVGTVEANLTATIGAEVAGAVARFDLREGERLAKGQVIARLRRTDLEIGLKEAQANLDEKRALFVRAEQDFQRFQALFAEGAISAAELDRLGAAARAAKAQKESAEEASRRVADQLRRTTVVAPFSGYLVKKHAEIGQWIEEGGKVADLVDIDIVYIMIPVNERDIGMVRQGNEATLTVDTYPGRVFRGLVTHIIPQADVASRNFPVRIKVDNLPDRLLKAGMFARVAVRYGEPRQGLFIPRDAVVMRGRDQVVFVVQDGKVRMVPVKAGRPHEGFSEMIEGSLKSGDSVVVTGNESLLDQAAVVVKDRLRN